MAKLKPVVNKLLTQASKMFVPQGFVAELILPEIKVKARVGELLGYGNNHLRIENDIAGGRGKYRFVDTSVYTTDTYKVKKHGLADIVTEEEYDNQEEYDVEEDKTLALTNLLLVAKEKGLADSLTNTSIITQNVTLSGTSQYSDYSGSDPIADFALARSAVRAGGGLPANKVVMDWATYNVLRFHPQILDALGFKYSRPGGVTEDELATALGVKKIFIAESMYNSSKEGQADNIIPIWGKDIVFFYAPDTAMKHQVSVGYRIQQENGPARRVITKPIDNPPESTLITVDDSYDQLLSNTKAAYLIKNAIA